MTDDDALIRKAYQESIRVALLKEWDPIGVSHFAEAADEYDAFVPDVVRLLVAHKTETKSLTIFGNSKRNTWRLMVIGLQRFVLSTD